MSAIKYRSHNARSKILHMHCMRHATSEPPQAGQWQEIIPLQPPRPPVVASEQRTPLEIARSARWSVTMMMMTSYYATRTATAAVWLSKLYANCCVAVCCRSLRRLRARVWCAELRQVVVGRRCVLGKPHTLNASLCDARGECRAVREVRLKSIFEYFDRISKHIAHKMDRTGQTL